MSKLLIYSGKLIARGVVCVLGFVGAVSAQTSTPANDFASTRAAAAQTIKAQVEKIGRGRDVTIVRHDGHEFYGMIMKIGDDFVAIHDVDEKAEVEIDFAHVRKITRGYGSVRAWNGKRIAPKKNIIGIVIATATVIAIPVLVVMAVKD